MESGAVSPFAGRVALVTGASSGIGRACAALLDARGARVTGLDLVPPEPGSVPAGVAHHACDVADDASVRAAVEAVVAAEGRLDVVVTCAGIGAQGTVEESDDDTWHRVLDVNVLGTARVVRAAMPHLRASPDGVVVTMCSVAATTGLPRRAVYSASKGAVLALTKAMAADAVGDGVRVVAVNPGTVDTPWVARLLAAADDPVAERAALEARQPTGRLVTASEVAEAVAYLASPGSGATTGTALEVDGGMARLRVPSTPGRA